MKTRNYWSDDEIEMLKRVYPTQSTPSVSRLLGRSINSILNKARKLGLKKGEVAEDQSTIAQP